MREYLVSETAKEAYGTLEEALEAVRMEEGKLPEGEKIRILVDGTLHFCKPLKIRWEDSISHHHPVLVEGIHDACISGGKILEGFSVWRDNIWRVHVPEAEYTRHLYIDGKAAKRTATSYRSVSRWEKLSGEDYCFSNLPGEEREEGDYSGIATTHTEIALWRNIRDVEMVFEVGWVHRIVPIEGTCGLPDGRLYLKPVEAAFTAAQNLPGVQIGGCPNCLENVFELLGNPLEWYFDREEKMLYVGFAEGDSPGNHTIVFPMTEQLLEVSGRPEEKPAHICFRNLTFSDTTWLRPARFGHPEIQANQLGYEEIPRELVREKPYENDYRKVIGAVRVLSARDVSFEDCTFTALGTGALQYEYGAEDCRIIGNHFYEIGGSAIVMGDFYGERAHHPADRGEIVRAIRVANNRIHHTGRDFKGSVAVIAGYVQDVEVSHNLIYEVPYTAISFGWGWGSEDVSVGPYRPTPWKEPSVSMRNKIMYNHIHHCMQVLCDGGAIYTLGCMTGTVIAGNYIHESAGYAGEGYGGVNIMGWNVEKVHDPAADPYFALHGVPGGIYLDEGSAGIEVCGNVLHDVAVPLHYHNQIDEGYKRVIFRENTVNKRPGQEGFPHTAAACAGLEPDYR